MIKLADLLKEIEKTPLDRLRDELNLAATSWDRTGRKAVAKLILANIVDMADIDKAVAYIETLKYSVKDRVKGYYVASLLKKYKQQPSTESTEPHDPDSEETSLGNMSDWRKKEPLAEVKKKEEPKIGAFEEFAETRGKGAEKITNNAKEKGGPSMLTYHHFQVKLPYYKKAAEGKLDLEATHKEYKELVKQLHTATKTNMNIDQVAFQKLVGKIEVLGELLIKHK